MTMGDSLMTTCRRQASAWCQAASRWLARWQYRLYTSPQARRVYLWNQLDAHRNLRYDYNLDTDAVVLDVGGFRGDWAAEIVARYGCRVHVFEPIAAFADQIHDRFGRNPNVTVHRFGLAATTRREFISLQDDASSTLRAGEDLEPIDLVDIAEFLADHDMTYVDLLKLNIEGGEYELIEKLLDSDLIDRVGDLQVQFHEDAVENADARMKAIQARLASRFELSYQVPFVWENWTRKRSAMAQAA